MPDRRLTIIWIPGLGLSLRIALHLEQETGHEVDRGRRRSRERFTWHGGGKGDSRLSGGRYVHELLRVDGAVNQG
jgi:hypothetical protein